MKILIIEDDNDIASLEKDYLEVENFQVIVINNGRDALKIIDTIDDYALIILDIMLPDINGYEICKKIRESSDIPIIIVTAKGESIDVIRGLGLGSDDYVIKPFDPAVLVARVKSNLNAFKRYKKINNIIKVKDLKIILDNYQVFKNDKEIKLPNKEFELLKYLVLNQNVVISKENLLEEVWGMDSDALEATVAVHINRIREKIEDNPSNPKIIETIWGVGYRFNSK